MAVRDTYTASDDGWMTATMACRYVAGCVPENPLISGKAGIEHTELATGGEAIVLLAGANKIVNLHIRHWGGYTYAA